MTASPRSLVLRPAQVVTAFLAAATLLLGVMVAGGPAEAASAPGKPTAVTAVAGNASASLRWKAPSSSGSSAITSYRYRYSTNAGRSWSSAASTSSAATSTTVSGLRNGTSYVFQVRAANRAGTGSWSSSSAAITPSAGTTVSPSPAPSQSESTANPAPSASESTSSPAPAPSESTTSPAPTPTTAAPTVTPSATATAPSTTWWAPAKGTAWQWQLTGTIDTSVNVPVFDIDGEDASAATVATLHAKGAKVICYFSAGSFENWRSDKAKFPASVKGKALDGWAGENWLDVRQLSVLLPIMEARIANCKNKGFDAVEPDNVDGYSNSTGFTISATDQIAYNKGLADLAHKYGLGIALKNDPDQAAALQPYFDFSVAEECAAYGECNSYTAFTKNNKAVLHVEYEGSLSSFCATTKPLGFSSMLKKLDLDAWRSPCP